MARAHLPKFKWEHDPVSHEDFTIDCPCGVYYKVQATRDRQGNCSGGKDNFYARTCGQPWGEQRDEFYCRLVFTDGSSELVSPPGHVQAKPYGDFLEHKKRMFREGRG